MKIGVHIFATDETIGIAELATEVERRGFESLWLPEHTHIPTSRESEWYRGRELPREYARTLDPFVALTYAAAATTTLRIGTAVLLAAQHDPLITAKTVATLDLISGGRLLLGVGLGWNLEEMRDHGVDPARRRSHAAESVQAMQGLWTQERFQYAGKHITFAETWMWPKPRQQPWPPVLFGGRGGGRSFRDIAEFGDGWMPDITMFRRTAFPGLLQELADACRARDREPVPVTAMGAPTDGARLAELASLGLDRLIFLLPSAPRGPVLERLDEIEQVVTEAGLWVAP